MLKKLFVGSATSAAIALLVPAVALAHVIVTPNQAGIGEELTFNVSVPNERQTPVVNLKLDIPKGVSEVTPTVATGWTIQTTNDGSTTDPEVSVITWSGGTIPVGQREDFSFSAQVPASATQLDWKAYQTYGDGTVVHWDQTPAGSDDATGNAGPYSVTKVVNDLNTAAATSNKSSSATTLPTALSIAAIVLSAGGLLLRKKR